MSRLLASTIFVFSIALDLCAQVQTGSILIKVTDQQGAILPGVSVTLSGSALVAGSMTSVTNEGGMQRFPSLVPGTYTVKLELPSFQTVVRENVEVIIGQTAPLDLQLKLATQAEIITVSEASPTVDTTSANVNVNIGEQLLQATPGGRDIWALLEGKVRGLVMSRPDVGGTSGGLQGCYSARGTTSGQNSQFLDGVNVGDPAAIGAAGYYDFDAFEDIQVSNGAHDISVPTGGVFLNMVTKTGGERWSGRTTFTWLGQGTQGRNVSPSLYPYGFTPTGNTSDFGSDINFSAGGPIVKDKLRFFGSFRDWRVHQNVPVANAQTVLDQTNITSGLGNRTWQLSSKDKVTGFYSRQRYNKPNRLFNSAAVTVKDSTSDEEDMFNVFQVLWNRIVTPNFYSWNDLNDDQKFEIGEQTGTPVVSAAFNPVTGEILSSIDPKFRRPYTDEYAAGLDCELTSNLRLSAVYTDRREKYPQVSLNPDNPYATTPATAVDPGLDGIVGTADDTTYQFFQKTSAANRAVITNDPKQVQTYKGLEITAMKRMSNRWQMLAGYPRSQNRLDGVTIATSPNLLINANGLISGTSNSDRPNLFKLTGSYIMPWREMVVSGNLRSESGPSVTRQISRSLALGGSETINLEPMGNHRLPVETTLDLRFGKQFNVRNASWKPMSTSTSNQCVVGVGDSDTDDSHNVYEWRHRRKTNVRAVPGSDLNTDAPNCCVSGIVQVLMDE